jgi:hypothetical protein
LGAYALSANHFGEVFEINSDNKILKVKVLTYPNSYENSAGGYLYAQGYFPTGTILALKFSSELSTDNLEIDSGDYKIELYYPTYPDKIICYD